MIDIILDLREDEDFFVFSNSELEEILEYINE